MKVLIIKTSSLGDIVHANSIISDLKRNHADAEIHWLVEESFSSLLNLFPVQKILVSKFRSWKKNLFKKRLYRPSQHRLYNWNKQCSKEMAS